MKILHVVAGLAKSGGGTSEVVPRLCEALVASGNEVRLRTVDMGTLSDAAVRAARCGVDFTACRRSSGILSRLSYSSELGLALDQDVRWADVVHLHGLWEAPCWMAAFRARAARVPYVVMPHGFLEPERLKISAIKKKVVGFLFDKPVLRRANGIVATSGSEVEGIRGYGLHQQVHIMPIGLDIEKYRVSMHQGKTLLYFSRITPVKGLDLLAEAWGAMDRKGWKLLIVGPDDRGYTEVARGLFAAKCPAGSYEFRGPVFGDEKYALLGSVDAMVLPTRSENWSIAVAEGMASGLPVVCTKGAPWECLETMHAGWWVDVAVRGIRQAMEELVSSDRAARVQMGQNGRRWVEDNLSWPHIVKEMVGFYRTVMC